MIALADRTISQTTMERLRAAYLAGYSYLSQLSARDLREQLKRLVPEASGAELDRALELAGHASDGRS